MSPPSNSTFVMCSPQHSLAGIGLCLPFGRSDAVDQGGASAPAAMVGELLRGVIQTMEVVEAEDGTNSHIFCKQDVDTKSNTVIGRR